MEAIRTSETSVYFNEMHGAVSQTDVIFDSCVIYKTCTVAWNYKMTYTQFWSRKDLEEVVAYLKVALSSQYLNWKGEGI
jgi:hypothetical protein